METDILKLSKSNTYSRRNSVLLLKSPGVNSFTWLLFNHLPRNKPFLLFSFNIYTKVNYDLRKTESTKAEHENAKKQAGGKNGERVPTTKAVVPPSGF